MLRLIAFACALPALAQADCPTREDLTTGITFTIDREDAEMFRSYDEGVVASFYMPDGKLQEGTQSLYVQGYYWVQIVDLDDDSDPVPGTRVTYSYPHSARDMPAPTPGAVAEYSVYRMDDIGITHELQKHEFGDKIARAYGGCIYDTIPTTIQYYEDDKLIGTDGMAYLPDLGVSLYVFADWDGEQTNYTYEIKEDE